VKTAKTAVSVLDGFAQKNSFGQLFQHQWNG